MAPRWNDPLFAFPDQLGRPALPIVQALYDFLKQAFPTEMIEVRIDERRALVTCVVGTRTRVLHIV